jgi:isoleucyl-tRNA synthetase
MYPTLPLRPDHNALELDILEFWEKSGIFEKVREKNRGNDRFSFTDGPVTANKSLAVHTAWGRTLKDVFQRYKALRGFDQRYQNGFDCQGLWIEVGVERQLGLNSKSEIEEYGLERFAEKCREVVEWSSAELTKGSIRLGQWMDWGGDYFTFSDTNIEYIWRFLQIVNERGWLYQGHRAIEWCPRCGTSISAHELTGSYVDKEDLALTVRFPLVARPGQAIVIWTTTPWTLPANVAAAVNPTATYGRGNDGNWMVVERLPEGVAPVETKLGSELVGWRYTAPFDDLEPNNPDDHVVIPWDEVSVEEGTGVVHIAPGCGAEDFALSKIHGLPARTPIDESGHFYPNYGWLAGRYAHEVQQEIIEFLRRGGYLVAVDAIVHRYPECWRCHTPLLFRLSDDWFISVAELRPQMRTANDAVEWTPSFGRKRMDDWLVTMGDWNISRRRYYGLPLPIYPCGCGHLTVVGSRKQLAELSGDSLEGLKELRRPWIDRIAIHCPACGEPVNRILEVGDVWLDAGIVPFSTLGWENDTWVEAGNGTGAAQGLTRADLPDHAYWERWFPADWVSEMREQTRLWFYSQLLMSVVLTDRAPFRQVLTYERMLAEDGREMHGSLGNMIEANDAFTQMGADVMRWQFCAQSPTQDLLFGFGPGDAIKAKILTLWNSVSFFVQYANIEGYQRPESVGVSALTPSHDHAPPGALLDRWLVARTRQLVSETTEAYERFLTGDVIRAFSSFVEDLSNWYIRLSRRRFWDGERAALDTLHAALVDAVLVIAPVMPFVSEHLWHVLRGADRAESADSAGSAGSADSAGSAGAAESVFLTDWPQVVAPNTELLADVAQVREIVELGRRVRSDTGLRLRQPLRALLVDGADSIAAYSAIIEDELRVKSVVFAPIEANELYVRPNLPVLGPKLGAAVPAVKKAMEAGEFTLQPDGSLLVAGHHLAPEEILVEKRAKEGWAVASTATLAVALDTELDESLVIEGRVYDAIHAVNTLRREQGLEITDRISLVLPATDADLASYQQRIAAETLADSIEFAGLELALSRC